MTITAGLSAVDAAKTLLESLRERLKSGQIKGDEIAGRIGEVYDFINDSKRALNDADDENQRLKRELSVLREDRGFRESLEFKAAGFYARIDSKGTEERYCAACLDEDQRRVRLTANQVKCDTHQFRHTVAIS